MNANVGSTDKVIRLVIAVAAAVSAFIVGATSVLGIVLLVLAALMVATSAMSFCPVYSLLGLNTCKIKAHSPR